MRENKERVNIMLEHLKNVHGEVDSTNQLMAAKVRVAAARNRTE